MAKRFKWVVEFEVDETWVADGFDMTQERAKGMIEQELGYSYAEETGARILKAPLPDAIRKVQGYARA